MILDKVFDVLREAQSSDWKEDYGLKSSLNSDLQVVLVLIDMEFGGMQQSSKKDAGSQRMDIFSWKKCGGGIMVEEPGGRPAWQDPLSDWDSGS